MGVPSLVESVTHMKMGLLHRLRTSSDPAVRHIAVEGLWGREVTAMARHFGVEHINVDTTRQMKKEIGEKRDEWSQSWQGKGADNFFGKQACNGILKNDLGQGRNPIDLLRLRSQYISCRVSRAISSVPNEELTTLTCRRCGEGQEDLMHLLQSCRAAQNHRVSRHDEVLKKLGQWLEYQLVTHS
ncbi:uncharacterized protein LOC121873576 [Homarus americanus]|uniref:uncharacterized protein LOC121865375 n=1 Tax=Homarus americanus TaxID=6706 RepID=UPI001C48452E|nr:uncharacterized protein LOC121865375 [Homarus americanus]XP_042233151.1 uncharacterized protein LOC121873576 [Homarus americanus]